MKKEIKEEGVSSMEKGVNKEMEEKQEVDKVPHQEVEKKGKEQGPTKTVHHKHVKVIFFFPDTE